MSKLYTDYLKETGLGDNFETWMDYADKEHEEHKWLRKLLSTLTDSEVVDLIVNGKLAEDSVLLSMNINRMRIIASMLP